MKKCKFYSIVMGDKGKPIAKLQDGYQDEYWYYYHNNATWYAIEPSTGLSITTGYTRKEAQQKATAPEMFKKVNDKITQYMIQRFNELRIEAEI